MMEKRGHGQSWSLDIILAFVIFMLIVGIFYIMLSKNNKPDIADIQVEASVLSSNLDSSTGIDTKLKIINDGALDKQKLIELYESQYDTIKNQFGITGDFCIYIVDQNGNIVTVNTTTGDLKNGFGNGELVINGVQCGSNLP